MATHASAEKAARQAVKKTARNRANRATFRTEIKRLAEGLSAKIDNKEEARKKLSTQLSQIQRLLTKAASKKIIKRETASRKISRLSQAIERALR